MRKYLVIQAIQKADQLSKFKNAHSYLSILLSYARQHSLNATLELFRLKYPRPRLNKDWQNFSRIMETAIRDILKTPGMNETYALLFLGYLKRKLYIISKSQGKKHGGKNRYKKHRYRK